MNGPLVCEVDGRRAKLIEVISEPKPNEKVTGIDYVAVKKTTAEWKITIHLFQSTIDDSLEVSLAGVEGSGRVLTKGSDSIVLTIPKPTSDQEDQEWFEALLVHKDPAKKTHHIDPVFASHKFHINPGRQTKIDFLKRPEQPQPIRPEPKISYLAKDYGSFKRQILDRLALIMPDWQDRHEADLGMTMVELLAYVGDQISYHQDAVATEAYLETARRRTSVRRHARLVDYRMHEGCNARTLLHLEVRGDTGFDPLDAFFTTKIQDPELESTTSLSTEDITEEHLDRVKIFEPMNLHPDDPWITEGDLFIDGSETSLARDLADDVLKALKKKNIEISRPNTKGDLVASLNEVIREQDHNPTAHNIRIEECNFDRQLGNRRVIDEALGSLIRPHRRIQGIDLYQNHNKILFYSWDKNEFWIEAGATEAVLIDQVIQSGSSNCKTSSSGQSQSVPRLLDYLRVGDILIFEEIRGPKTGDFADANPGHRQAVRISQRIKTSDPVSGIKLLKIKWCAADKLMFPVCVAAQTSVPSCQQFNDISVARGNIISVDHGFTVHNEYLGQVESKTRQVNCETECYSIDYAKEALPFHAKLKNLGITHSSNLKSCSPASQIFDQELQKATASVQVLEIPSDRSGTPLPIQPLDLSSAENSFGRVVRFRSQRNMLRQLALEDLLDNESLLELEKHFSTPRNDPAALTPIQIESLKQKIHKQIQDSLRWDSKNDLIDSKSGDKHFVIEMDENRRASVRFGDGINGQQPRAGAQFYATYRVGNGESGNVGANSINHVIFRRNFRGNILSVRNPFPARGGVNSEDMQRAKLIAPYYAINNQQRAILAEDYIDIVKREFGDRVQEVLATIYWDNISYHVCVIVDPLSVVPESDHEALRKEIEDHLESYRRISHDVRVITGKQVKVQMTAQVVKQEGVFESDIRIELEEIFSDRVMSDGRLGFFHPDQMTFGNTIYQSQLVAAVARVSGILGIEFSIERMTNPQNSSTFTATPKLEFKPTEIPTIGSFGIRFTNENQSGGGKHE